MKSIIGKKVGMTQVFGEDGQISPVTLIEAGPCYVTQKKTNEKDGYTAIQLGFEEVTSKKGLNKPSTNHLKKANVPLLKHLKEFRLKNHDDLELGQKIDVSIFEGVQSVDVTGISKGKGFAGVVKRHGFAGGPKTHGQSDRHRAPGSIGAGTTPGHVFKGMRMPGRMGGERVTVSNLKVVIVDAEKNLLAVKGAIPGAKDGLLIIKEARKAKKGNN